ncbi:Rieske (2Fe-2S) protein [Pseudofrankia saprophytica]|uniref:Rieske (2Fe-2S) protein n=1 Tax=Pseudofrankia saprophytica TaxID=298655 RepID=UPI000234CD1D|nr:Rieske (2Fe-2S) protein [Pseudofrankia saprophytica]
MNPATETAHASPDGRVVHRLGPLADIPLGEARAYAAGGRQIAVFRLRSGQLRAIDAVCPHAGGPLADGQADDTVVICPLHSSTFDLTTGISPSGAPPLTCYPIRVSDDGIIEITIG